MPTGIGHRSNPVIEAGLDAAKKILGTGGQLSEGAKLTVRFVIRHLESRDLLDTIDRHIARERADVEKQQKLEEAAKLEADYHTREAKREEAAKWRLYHQGAATALELFRATIEIDIQGHQSMARELLEDVLGETP